MRTLPPEMTAIIASGDFEGDNRAVTRITVQKFTLGLWPGTDKSKKKQIYSSILFTKDAKGAHSPAYELPNLISCKWVRSAEAELATLNFEMNNSMPLPAGVGPSPDGQFDQRGFFTPRRGSTAYLESTFGQARNYWEGYLVPDRIVRVYQGYGVDYSELPENDPHMVLMGCFLIDDVTFTADGTISVACRDVGRSLVDQIMFPPVVPFKNYPLSFSKYVTKAGERTTVPASGGGWFRPRYQTDSNVPYVGLNGSVYGHHGSDAFDTSLSTYWLSVGNAKPNRGYSFEYVQGKFTARKIEAVRVKTWGGPYRAYLSLKVAGKWLGRAVIPYDPNNPASAPNGANIKYVASKTAARDDWTTFKFSAVKNVEAVRITFTDLYNSGIGVYKYRAGVRKMEVLASGTKSATTTTGPSVTTGNYGDYTDIVRLLLAYGGFFWPKPAVQKLSAIPGNPANVRSYTYADVDPYLGSGRIWGDLQNSGTAGVTDLGVEIFDKKPLMDGITYVRDILGFIFYIDEQGAAQFRSPNLFSLGNWKWDTEGLGASRTIEYKTLYDDQALLELRAQLSSRNLREKVFIGNVPGKIGAVANGRIPYPSGLRRVGGWTDEHFATEAEAIVMADLITLRQLFSFRKDTMRIAADPSIQVDDQVKIVERVTSEAYFHRVESLSSEWNAKTGVWTYDLTTSWLGADPNAEWAFKSTQLAAETQAYLNALGELS